MTADPPFQDTTRLPRANSPSRGKDRHRGAAALLLLPLLLLATPLSPARGAEGDPALSPGKPDPASPPGHGTPSAGNASPPPGGGAAGAPADNAATFVRIAAVGDVMMGSAYPKPWLPPDDGERIFDAVRFAFDGRDVVLANLEGTLYDGDGPSKCDLRKEEREREERRRRKAGLPPEKRLCYAFRTPTRYVRHLSAAGIGAVHVANNHARDFLDAGLASTLSTLEGAGIAAVGGERVGRFEAGGTRVSVLGFSYSWPSPTSLPLLDLEAAGNAVREAKAEGGLVVVSFHGGAEGKTALRIPGGMETFAGEKRGDVAAFAHAVVDAGADLVLGHGPHVPRAMELYRGKLVAYSLGNFLAYGGFNLTGESGTAYVLRADLDGETGDFRSGRIVPVLLRDGGIPVPDPAGEAVKLVRELTRLDRDGGGLEILDDGTVLPAGSRN